MTPKWLAAVWALLALGAAPAHADRVDEYVRCEMRLRRVPGVSVAVVRAGRIVRAKGYGLANVELSVPATRDTVYELASLTKQFTATAVMLLVDEGKVDLDEKITQYLEGLPAAWGGVTVRQLLNHTSGIKDYTSVPGFLTRARTASTREEILKLVVDAPLEFASGEKWRYSNTGYLLLGTLIEKVSGKEYGAFLRERIFQPLGMKHTRVNDLSEVIPNRATGYSWQGNHLRNGEYWSPSVAYASGDLISTVVDMAKWDAALYTDRVLKQAVLRRMWLPTRLADGTTQDYGFGWGMDTYRTRRRVGHDGGIAGFSTTISRFLEDRLTVMVLSNSDTAAAGTLAKGIAAFYIPALREHAPMPIADPDPKTTRHLRHVLAGIAEGKADPRWFTEPAQQLLFPDRMAEAKGVLAGFGAPTAFELMEQRPQEKRRTLSYRVRFGETAFRVVFAVTEEGKIDRFEMLLE